MEQAGGIKDRQPGFPWEPCAFKFPPAQKGADHIFPQPFQFSCFQLGQEFIHHLLHGTDVADIFQDDSHQHDLCEPLYLFTFLVRKIFTFQSWETYHFKNTEVQILLFIILSFFNCKKVSCLLKKRLKRLKRTYQFSVSTNIVPAIYQ